MAKKNANTRRTAEESEIAVKEDARNRAESQETAAPVLNAEDPPISKTKQKAPEDSVATGSVGISDIRKAVAFANSVGGLDKAISLLQILKVAKEVQ